MVSRIIINLKIVMGLSRPAVAMILFLFTAIGAVEPGKTLEFTVPLISALAAVWLILINAASLNDLADQDIDRMNLPNSFFRPLAGGLASRRLVWTIALTSAALASLIAFMIEPKLLIVALFGLTFNWLYCLPPIQISRRPIMTPLLVPVAYMAVPYVFGLFMSGHALTWSSLIIFIALYICFAGRILLKDFRDVQGDSFYGKQTFLLKFGRQKTCLASAALWLVGTAMLFEASASYGLIFAAYLPFIFAGLLFLYRARNQKTEQIIIWAIARVGTAMALSFFAYSQTTGNSLVYQTLILTGISLPFMGQYFSALAPILKFRTRRAKLIFRISADASHSQPAPLADLYF